MSEREDPIERTYSSLFQQLPQVPAPPGFRDTVMARIARERRQRIPEAVVAAALALPSLAFLAWELAAQGGDFALAVTSLFDAIWGEWQSGELVFFIDGLSVLAIAMLGLAGMLLTHALLADVRPRQLRPATSPTR